MAERKVGSAVLRFNLVPHLAIFRLIPQRGDAFPAYRAGQYIALRRDHCRLTRRVVGDDGVFSYIPDMLPDGTVKRGPVTHSYSISSAPYETAQEGWLEFYVILERSEHGTPGRLTESLFSIDPGEDDQIVYYTKIAGDFTLEKRTAGFANVVCVGTGTGLAPFASMIKQLNHEALGGKAPTARYTLFHANRTVHELGYHATLHAIQDAGKFDFLYVPTISRPSGSDGDDPHIGRGRANNVLRYAYGLPLREEEEVHEALDDASADRAHRREQNAIHPVLPSHVTKADLARRLDPASTVILTCGNPLAMDDIQRIAGRVGAAFEKEEW